MLSNDYVVDVACHVIYESVSAFGLFMSSQTVAVQDGVACKLKCASASVVAFGSISIIRVLKSGYR